jgi:hypothetical protein
MANPSDGHESGIGSCAVLDVSQFKLSLRTNSEFMGMHPTFAGFRALYLSPCRDVNKRRHGAWSCRETAIRSSTIFIVQKYVAARNYCH